MAFGSKAKQFLSGVKNKVTSKLNKRGNTIVYTERYESKVDRDVYDDEPQDRYEDDSYNNFEIDVITLNSMIATNLNEYERNNPPDIMFDPRMGGLRTDQWIADVKVNGPVSNKATLIVFISNQQDDFKYYNKPRENRSAKPNLNPGESYLGISQSYGILGNMAARRLTRRATGRYYPRQQFIQNTDLREVYELSSKDGSIHCGATAKRYTPKLRFFSKTKGQFIMGDSFAFKNDKIYAKNIFRITDETVKDYIYNYSGAGKDTVVNRRGNS